MCFYLEISVALFVTCEASLNTKEQEKDTRTRDSKYSLRVCSGKTLSAHVFFPLFFPLPKSATTRRSHGTLLSLQFASFFVNNSTLICIISQHSADFKSSLFA